MNRKQLDAEIQAFAEVENTLKAFAEVENELKAFAEVENAFKELGKEMYNLFKEFDIKLTKLKEFRDDKGKQ